MTTHLLLILSTGLPIATGMVALRRHGSTPRSGISLLLAGGLALIAVRPALIMVRHWDNPDAVDVVAEAVAVVVSALLLAAVFRWHSTVTPARAGSSQFQGMLELAAVGMVIMDRQGRIVDANQTLCTVLGYELADLQGMAIADLTHPEERAQGQTLLEQVFSGASDGFMVEERFLRRDGRAIWVRVSASLVRKEPKLEPFVLGVVEDVTAYKTVEEALHSSERRFKAIFDSGVVGVLVLDSEGRIVEWNQAFERMTGGYTQADLRGEHLMNIVHPDDRNRCTREFTALANGKKLYCQISNRIIRKNGDEMWIEIAVSAMLGVGHQLSQAVAIVKDITESKLYERMLQDQWTFMRRIIDANPNLIFVKNPTGRYVLVNEAFAQRVQVDKDAIIGKLDHEINPDPEQAAYFGEQDAEVLITGEPLVINHKVKAYGTVSGERWHQTVKVPVLSPEGTSQLLLGVATDITELKNAQMQLERSEAINQAIIHAMPDMLFRLGCEGRIIQVYASDKTLLAAPEDSLIGKRLDEVMPPDVSKLAMANIVSAFRTGVAQPLEYTLELPGGQRVFEGRFVRIMADEVLAIVRDVTPLKQAEQQAVRLALDEERSRILSEFIRDAAHEFAQPISVIRTALYLAQHMDDPDERNRRLETVSSQMHHIQQLVLGMVTMLRLDQGFEFEFAAVGMHDLLENVAGAFRDQAEAKGLVLECASCAELPTITAAWEQLVLALGHLVDNAIRFTPAPGTVRVSAECTPEGVQIAIQDSGIGIDAAHHERIFERFYRVDRQRMLRGAGLGLSIARKVIEQHAGTLRVQSALGEGSTFLVDLPLDCTN